MLLFTYFFHRSIFLNVDILCSGYYSMEYFMNENLTRLIEGAVNFHGLGYKLLHFI